MSDIEKKALRGDLIAKMYDLEFWLAVERKIPDTDEKVMQFRRTDGAVVDIVIKG